MGVTLGRGGRIRLFSAVTGRDQLLQLLLRLLVRENIVGASQSLPVLAGVVSPPLELLQADMDRIFDALCAAVARRLGYPADAVLSAEQHERVVEEVAQACVVFSSVAEVGTLDDQSTAIRELVLRLEQTSRVMSSVENSLLEQHAALFGSR